MGAKFRWKARQSQMALRYLGLPVSLKLQTSNEKSRRLGKMSIFLQGRLKWSWNSVTIFRKLNEDAASRSYICYWGPSSYPYYTWCGVSLSLIFPMFCWPRLKWCTSLFKTEQDPGRYLRLDHGAKYLFSFDRKPAYRLFCQGSTRSKKSCVDRQNDWWPTS